MGSGRLTTGEGDSQWYALRVQPQKEYTVAYMLRKAGVRTFVPTDTKFRRRTRYSKSKAEYASPVIASCVFAGFDGDPQWYNIMRNHLIMGPEGMDGRPWKMNIAELYRFFASQLDGCMVLDEGVRVVFIQGRGERARYLRAPTTQTKVISKRRKDGELVVEATGRRAKLLERFVIPERAVLMAAA